MGSDLTVVNTARVSFNKQTVRFRYGRDDKLIEYLAKHGHWSPFAHCFAQFRISAPIFVARQLVKHQVGLSWNEVSRRYVDEEPVFYMPEGWRKRADNVKQGSSDELISYNCELTSDVYQVIDSCVKMYTAMTKHGDVAPEMARMILPQNMMTEWIWSGSLMAFARVCKQRLDPHAQLETREVAEQINNLLKENYEYSWKALMEN